MRYQDIKMVEVTHLMDGQLENEGIQGLITRGYPAYALLIKKATEQLSRSAVSSIIQGVFISNAYFSNKRVAANSSPNGNE